MKFIEEGPGLRAGLKDLPKSLNAGTIGSGLIASIFGCTGPAMVVISAA
ncbi:benzoate transporter, partial [Romboutsia ilealis]|nr:benzoate transporter [Romboutsia ilealis]